MTCLKHTHQNQVNLLDIVSRMESKFPKGDTLRDAFCYTQIIFLIILPFTLMLQLLWSYYLMTL